MTGKESRQVNKMPFQDTIQKWLYCQKFRHIPGPPPDSFFNGHQLTLMAAKKANKFLDCFLTWRGIYGDTFQFRIKTRPVIFTVDPEILKLISQDVVSFTKVDHLPNRALFGQRITGTYSILTGGGQEWAIKRRIMSSFFAKQNMNVVFDRLTPLMSRLLETKLKPRAGTGNVLDIHEIFTIIFSALPGVLGMECEMGVDSPEEIGRRINIFLDVIPSQLGNLKKVFGAHVSTKKQETIDMVVEMRMMGKKMVDEKRKDMESWDSNPEDDLLAWLISANDAAGLGDEEVIDDILTVYLVMDNMSKQLGSLFIYLINYREVFDKMVEELRANPVTDYKSLNKLRYTEMVLLESLRLAPVLLRGTRWLNKSIQAGKYWIPGDCQFQYSQYVLHRIEEYWPNPREFIPERFEKGIPNVDSFTFFPFLAGPRACLGKHVAMIAMKMTLSMLVNNYDLTPVPTETVPVIVQTMAVTRLKGGPMYKFDPLYRVKESAPQVINEY